MLAFHAHLATAFVAGGAKLAGKPRGTVAMLGSLFGLMPQPEMVKPEDALPGRPTKMRVADRHYVLGNKMEGPGPENYKVAVFANGCFWGSEKGIWRLPGDGIHTTAVGYAAGFTPNPTYEEACSGRSGHTEAVQLVYDPAACDYAELCRTLFSRVNPTLLNRVGNDVGTQYRHGIYTHTAEQAAEAKRVWDAVNEQTGGRVVTELLPAEVYWPAEEYHQQYLAKGGRAGNPQSPAKGCTDTIRCYG